MNNEPAKSMFHQAEADSDNMAAVRHLRSALNEGSLTQLEFSQTWRDAANYFQIRSNLVGIKLLLMLMSKAPAYNSTFGQLVFQQYSGMVLLIEGAADKARDHFQQEYRLALDLADPAERITATLNIARACLLEFNLAQAQHSLDQARQGLDDMVDAGLTVKTLNREAELAAYQHRTDLSIEKASQALELARALHMPLEEAFALNWLGVNWIYQRKMERAEQALLEALRIRQHARDVIGRADTLANLSRYYFKKGELALAFSSVEGGLAIMRQLKNRPGTAQSLYWKATLLYRTGQSQSALPLAMEAVEIRLELGEPTKLAEAFSLMGQIYAALGDRPLALTCHRRVLELHEPHRNTPQWIELLATTGDYLLHTAEADPDSQVYWQEGLQAYRQAVSIIEQYEDLYYLAPLLGRMARGLLKSSGAEGILEAQRCYRLQLSLLGDIESPYFPTGEAIAQRAEALNGLQVCGALLRRPS